MGMNEKENIAVVGGGITGLVMCYLLRHKYNITLYEKTHRVGGNACTVTDPFGAKYEIGVSLFVRKAFPLFYKLLDELKVKTRAYPGQYMSCRSLDTEETIYLNPTLKSLRTQRYEVLYPKNIYRVLSLFAKVNYATRYGIPPFYSQVTLDDLCKFYFKFDEYQRIILYIALALLTSMPPEQLRGAPGWFFIAELKKYPYFTWHTMFNIEAIRGWTQRYVTKLASKFEDRIVLNANIDKITRSPNRATIKFKDGATAEYDKVIITTEADRALDLLADPTSLEQELLGAWSYNDGLIVAHGEIERLAALQETGAFPYNTLNGIYDFLYTGSGDTFNTSVNGITSRNVVVTQYPNFPISKDKIYFKQVFRTPIFDEASINTGYRLPELNANGTTYFCGSYFGFGLHEDVMDSAVAVARQLGVIF